MLHLPRLRDEYRLFVTVIAAASAAAAGCSSSSRGPDTTTRGTLSVPRVRWAIAEQLITDCKVKRVEQTHRKSVTLTLLTGRRLFTREPHIDDVIHDVNRVAGKCPPITLATE